MRITSFAVLTLLAASAAFAENRSETTTYIDGNLPGISPNTGGTLLISEDKSMFFRTGLTSVAVPYSGISHAELGAVRETSHDVPFYKVWARRHSKTETQYLIINFKNDEGEDRTATLELAQSSAAGVIATLEERTGKSFTAEGPAAKKTQVARDNQQKKPVSPEKAAFAAGKVDQSGQAWWGDDMWRTSRNADKWNGKTSPDQR